MDKVPIPEWVYLHNNMGIVYLTLVKFKMETFSLLSHCKIM